MSSITRGQNLHRTTALSRDVGSFYRSNGLLKTRGAWPGPSPIRWLRPVSCNSRAGDRRNPRPRREPGRPLCSLHRRPAGRPTLRDDSQGRLGKPGTHVHERSSCPRIFGGRILIPDLSPHCAAAAAHPRDCAEASDVHVATESPAKKATESVLAMYPSGQYPQVDRSAAIATDQAARASRAACQFHGRRSAILFAG
jgi:hypothetical protein